MPKKVEKKKAPRRGGVAVAVFEQVAKLETEEKLGRTEALRRVATKTGSGFGTVAANYYREARKRGVKLRKRARSGTAAKAARGPRRGTRSAADVRGIVQALRDAATLLERQASEIARLQKENERFAQVRRLVGRA